MPMPLAPSFFFPSAAGAGYGIGGRGSRGLLPAQVPALLGVSFSAMPRRRTKVAECAPSLW